MPVGDQSIGSWALLTKSHPRQVFLDSFFLGRITGGNQAIGECKEAFFFLIYALQTGLDQTHDDAACRRALALRQSADSTRHAWRKRHALSNGSFQGWHSSRIHQPAPTCTSNIVRSNRMRRQNGGGALPPCSL